MEKIVNAHHRRLIGWSEIRQGGLASKRHDHGLGRRSRRGGCSGHDVVMSPLADCYFDHYQSLDKSREPLAIGGYLPLRQVYAFEPIPTNLPVTFNSTSSARKLTVDRIHPVVSNTLNTWCFPGCARWPRLFGRPRPPAIGMISRAAFASDCLRLNRGGVNYRPLTDSFEETMAEAKTKSINWRRSIDERAGTCCFDGGFVAGGGWRRVRPVGSHQWRDRHSASIKKPDAATGDGRAARPLARRGGLPRCGLAPIIHPRRTRDALFQCGRFRGSARKG